MHFENDTNQPNCYRDIANHTYERDGQKAFHSPPSVLLFFILNILNKDGCQFSASSNNCAILIMEINFRLK